MNMERNRFEYGHIIDQNTFEQTAEEIKREVCEKINFKNGILREMVLEYNHRHEMLNKLYL